MTKEEAMQRFKNACGNKINNEPIARGGKGYRQISVETQFNRGRWEADDEDGKIRIDNGTPPEITAFHTVEFTKNNCNGIFVGKLTPQEYSEPEALFFGGYIPDTDYLKKIGAIV